ncbi:MAG: glycosyltransferase, partial [Nitrococcus sp.]|nr:glycosyltransferase [Nitrococcus sp.]
MAVSDIVDIEVWLPSDIDYAPYPLTERINRLGIPVKLQDLPVLRRAYRNVGGAFATLIRLVRIVRRLYSVKPDVIYANTSAMALLACCARLLRIRAIFHLHEHLSGIDRSISAVAAYASQATIAVSEDVAATLPAHVQSTTRVVYNGFGIDDTLGREYKTTDSDDIVFVLASRWNSWKGHETILKAWKDAARRDS